MVFGLFKRKDPVCGMKEEKGKGLEKHEKWFCSQDCMSKFDQALKKSQKHRGGSCCH
ncbi:YHS domain-containing protein [Candidatus Woesearchaeota archaeon]|nr:YHS domain-containing protein [Candidatus Woesearchaeota archaeon]